MEQRDAENCGKIGHEAHKAISSAHGYPSGQPSEEFAIGLIKTLLENPNSWGALAPLFKISDFVTNLSYSLGMTSEAAPLPMSLTST